MYKPRRSGNSPRRGPQIGATVSTTNPSRLRNYTKEDRGHETPCHIWRGRVNKDGYGTVKVRGYNKPVHRAAYEQHHSEVLSVAWDVHHLCETPLCINVQHLRALSKVDHRQVHAKVKKEDVPAIQAEMQSAPWGMKRRTAEAIAARFGVKPLYILSLYHRGDPPV
jgi:hypothetical protein